MVRAYGGFTLQERWFSVSLMAKISRLTVKFANWAVIDLFELIRKIQYHGMWYYKWLVIVTEWICVEKSFTSNEGTLGITGWCSLIIQIDGDVWHLDVVLSCPKCVQPFKGPSVRRLIWYIRWVKYVVRQYGPYLPRC